MHIPAMFHSIGTIQLFIDVAINIGSDHRMVMRNINLDVEVERKSRPPRVDTRQLGSKTIEFKVELIKRFEAMRACLDACIRECVCARVITCLLFKFD